MTENNEVSTPSQAWPFDQQRPDDIITVVLTADNHLGASAFSQQLQKREAYQHRLRSAFQQATDFAIGQGVDLFVQAGDLFDTPTPGEKDRSFVAARLAQLQQAGIRAFALGGVHDTSPQTGNDAGSQRGNVGAQFIAPNVAIEVVTTREENPFPNTDPAAVVAAELSEDAFAFAPQGSFARSEALHYFAPVANSLELEPVFVKIRNVLVGICGLGVLAGQEGDPLAGVHVQHDIESAALTLLILHAPIEDLVTGSSWLDTHAQVSYSSIEQQTAFRYILAGYHHNYRHLRVGHCDVIVAGATQQSDFRNVGTQFIAPNATSNGTTDQASATTLKEPGFVFLGLAADGIRWCNYIPVDTLKLQVLVIHTNELWPYAEDSIPPHPTDTLIERLRPLCIQENMVQLHIEGQITRNQYHQLDLNQVRRYGEEQCFALIIDDSSLEILPGNPLRFSPREELVALADEWIAAAGDEREKKALLATREELLAALDELDTWPAGGMHRSAL